VDHPGRKPAAISADVHIPPGCHRMIGRGHHPGWQPRPDFLHQGAQVSLGARILFQQVPHPGHPLRLQRRPGLLHILTRGLSELVARLRQPLLGQLGLTRIPAAQQPREAFPGRLPRIGHRRGHHRVPGQRRQRHQGLRQRHPRRPLDRYLTIARHKPARHQVTV
jgi:hypothetical protein